MTHRPHRCRGPTSSCRARGARPTGRSRRGVAAPCADPIGRHRYAPPMKLGLNLGYWGLVSAQDNMDMVTEAERLGFSVVWAAEAYGNDAATVLTWIAAKTSTIDVGSAIFQIPGRTPAMTAMT